MVKIDLGPGVMMVASVCTLLLIHGYSPPDSSKAQTSEPIAVATANEIEEPAELQDAYLIEDESDWMFFDKTVFILEHRYEHNGGIQYEVKYTGSDLHSDLMDFGTQLMERHEGTNITILVQSSTNSELITHICENGKVIAIE